jgi:signal transduction histidine kinase
LLTDTEGQRLTIYTALGPEQEVAHTVSIPVGKGFAGRIASTGEPIVITDLSGAEVVNPFLKERLHSIMGVPLMSEGQVVGVLHVGTVDRREFTEGEVRLLQVVADRVVVAIEQARLFEAERRARAEAQEAAHLREEFLAIASHELKTPLTGIKGYVQLLNRLLKNARFEREEAVDLITELDGQVVRLQALVGDLLDASQIARGRLDLHPEDVDLSDLAARVLARFEVAAERTREHILVLDAPAPVVGCFDSLRIEQVLSNLISNAIKYSPDGGEVRVRVAQTDDEAELSVIDQGIGIAEEEQGFLFQPFVRGQSTRSIKGTGLGLFIVSRIVEDHGGSISVQSAAGAGSTFVVRLPLTVPAGQAEGPVEKSVSP